MIYEKAKPADQQAIESLLSKCDLPAEDIGPHLQHFLVARDQDRVVGCVGMEMEGPLLRSLAVDPSYRSHAVGKTLCEDLLKQARSYGVSEIFLLTTTAAGFFGKMGFQRKNRAEAPESIRKNRQFTELCPSSAVLMCKKLM